VEGAARTSIATNLEMEATIELLARDSDRWQAECAAPVERASNIANVRDGLAWEVDVGRPALARVERERDRLVDELASELTRVVHEGDVRASELGRGVTTLADVRGERDARRVRVVAEIERGARVGDGGDRYGGCVPATEGTGGRGGEGGGCV
jgi:hypothetical protein